MTVRENVVVSAAVRDKLGPSLDQVLDSLWLIDCQTCNQPLPGRRPALSVDDFSIFASATLHHHECRQSAWNETDQIRAAAGETVSHHTLCVLLPVAYGDNGEEGRKPFVLVNPGLEMIYLARSALGQWAVKPNRAFVDAGFAPPPLTSTPVPGAVVELRGNQLVIGFRNGLMGPFDVNLNDEARNLVVAEGGAVVLMTHAIDPHEITDPTQLEPALSGDRTLMGYTQLAG
ncbi:hypothetical protein ACQPXM_41295 (plasmid) [Kribbella sp. CA-253562]|uniref:hypothetical protein n=1 Tax=Kribbella sp. CA-253562 TaxID=3239942 RepID=UPI003D945E1B